MKLAPVPLLLLLAPLGAAQTVRYTSGGFEAPTFTPGILADDALNQFGGTGQDDWIATPDPFGTIDFSKMYVQTQDVHAGAQAITIDATGQNFSYMHLRRNTQFNPANTPGQPVVDIRMWILIEDGTVPSEAWSFQAQSSPMGGLFAWDIHPDGLVRYVDPSISQEVNTGVTVTRGVWHHIITSLDYPTETVTVYIDGNQIASFPGANGMFASSPAFAFASLALFGPGDDRMHVDDFEILSRPQGPPDFLVGSPYCPGVTNSAGLSGGLRAIGSAVASANDLRLEAFDLPNNQPGMFLVGTQNGFTAHPGGSQGNLCLGGTLGRYNAPFQYFFSGTTGAGSLVLDLTHTPTATGSTAIGAGQTWYFQCWYRDLIPGQTTNFTGALEIQFQ
ncbi:MAG: LamG-like jellyroll fold domain-containing protein [Planctomycetota bacterium]